MNRDRDHETRIEFTFSFELSADRCIIQYMNVIHIWFCPFAECQSGLSPAKGQKIGIKLFMVRCLLKI